jgi:UDP-glucose 4-epimerase
VQEKRVIATTPWELPSRVLITGGTGFVGTYLARALLASGRSVTALALEDFNAESLFVLGDLARQVQVVRGDIRDTEAMRKLAAELRPDAIIHTAALVGLEPSLENPTLAYNININGSIALLEAARLAGVKKFIYASSNAVYHLKEYDPIDERHPITSLSVGNPAGHYGTSKMAAEQIGLAYATFHGLDFIALRISAIYGLGMRGAIYIKTMVEAAVDGQPLVLQGGPMKRDYTSIADTVSGIMQALDRDTRTIEQRVFNMSSGRAVTVRELAEVVCRHVPQATITVGDELTEPERVNIGQRGALSSEAATKFLGFTPVQDISAGVGIYITSLREFRRFGLTSQDAERPSILL